MNFRPELKPSTATPVSEDSVWNALRHVVDPEIGVNIVDLGLVYSVQAHGSVIDVVMTVTTPGCPMVHSLTFGVETAVLAVAGVKEVRVEVVYEPPWSPDMMTPEGRRAAGIR